MQITRILHIFTHKKIIASTLAVFVLVALVGFCMMPAQAGNQRVVTIHDGARTQTVTTDAASIEEVLKRAKVTIENNDLVEPSLNTALVSPAYSVNIYRARPVTIVDGNSRKLVMTPYQSPRSIVKNANMQLYDEDEVKSERIDNVVTDGAFGLKVSVDRAIPLTLVLYGTPTPIRTQATTVASLLQEKNIKLGPQDGMSLPASAPITENMILDVWRNGAQTKTEEQPVAFETERIQNTEKPVGFKQITEAGQPGKKIVTYQIELRNGKEVARKEIQSVVVQQPKKQVEIVGTKPSFSGDFVAALAKLRSCEGGYTSVNPAGYYGAYQFNISTWRGAAPAGYQDVRPDKAPPAVQDQAARNLYMRRGWQPWPVCGKNLPDIYR